MKIALYKDMTFGNETVMKFSDWNENPDRGYVRMSDPIEVEFTSSGDTTQKEIAVLQGVKEKLQAKAQVEINAVQQRIDDLLALPDMS